MSYEQYRPGGFRVLPPVVKNLIIINVLFFLATYAIGHSSGFDLSEYLGLHFTGSPLFRPHQLVSYMFMHGGIMHILFNMFALWMFGNVLENVWGPKRFLIYYMVTGIGAGVLQLLVLYIQAVKLESSLSPDTVSYVYEHGYDLLMGGNNFSDSTLGKLNVVINSTTVGASGAVFGILLAFGMLFPNTILYIYFAFPIKAKYFVMIYGALELYMGFANNPSDNVAHFAHLGGMIFGFFMIKYWQKHPRTGRY